MDDDSDTTSASASDCPVPCDVQLLSGNQFRAMMEKELRRPPAPTSTKRPDTCPTCKQQVKPKPKRPAPPAGRAMQAVRHMPLPGNLQEPGKAEEYYHKMLEEKEKVKLLTEEKKTWRRQIADLQKESKAEKKQEDVITSILKVESNNHKVNGLLKEIANLNGVIRSLREQHKVKAKELNTLQATSPSTSKGRTRKMINELKKSDDTIHMLRSQLTLNTTAGTGTGSTADIAAVTKSEDLKQRNATLRHKVSTLKEDISRAEGQANQMFLRTLMAEWALHATGDKRIFVEKQLVDSNELLAKEKERYERAREGNEETIKHLEATVQREHERVVSTAGQLQQIQYHVNGRGTEEWALMVRDYDDKLSKKDNEITELEGKLLESERQYRDFVAQTRDSEAQARKKTSALFKEDIVGRDATIERLERELLNLTKQTKGLNTEKNANMHAASARDDEVKKQVETYKTQVSSLKERLREMRKENHTLKALQTAQDAKIEQLRQEQERQRLSRRGRQDDDEEDADE